MSKAAHITIVFIFFFITIFISCGNISTPPVPKNSHLNQSQKDSISRMIAGMFVGKMPCADCEGINYSIMLSSTWNYSTKSVYVGKESVPFLSKGKWRLIGDSIIALENTSDVPSYLQIINRDSLHMLDASMKRMTSPLESMFALKRGDEETLSKDSSGIQDAKYVLEMLNDKIVSVVDYKNEVPYLVFAMNRKTVLGFAGCNTLTGEIKIYGDTISFLNMALTRMMCPGDGEANFLTALRNTKTFKVRDDKIYLMNASQTLAVFLKGKE